MIHDSAVCSTSRWCVQCHSEANKCFFAEPCPLLGCLLSVMFARVELLQLDAHQQLMDLAAACMLWCALLHCARELFIQFSAFGVLQAMSLSEYFIRMRDGLHRFMPPCLCMLLCMVGNAATCLYAHRCVTQKTFGEWWPSCSHGA